MTKPKPSRPSIFISSSSEGLDLARAVRTQLEDAVEVTLWDDAQFALGSTTIESLVDAAAFYDFVALVLTADDLMLSRSLEVQRPRENVIFELGFFMGNMGRQRTFVIGPKDSSLELPSDLAGFVIAYYDWPRIDNNAKAAVGSACDVIRMSIRQHGSRRRIERASDGTATALGDDWGALHAPLLDSAIDVGDWQSYVNNPEFARKDIQEAIEADAVIPSRHHYSNDVLAARWITRCDEPTYTYQRRTVQFWRTAGGKKFARAVMEKVDSQAFDFVSLGPGDGVKDAELVRYWLSDGADLLYYPYDVSYPLIVRSIKRVESTLLKSELLRVKAVLAEFHDLTQMRAVFGHRSAPNVVGLLGTLGNLRGELAFLDKLRRTMNKGDHLLLEVRLRSGMQQEELSQGSPLSLAGTTAAGMKHDFGPLEQYFGLRFSEEHVKPSWRTDISDIRGTKTLVITYRGAVPGMGRKDREVKLQYIHLYDHDSFVDVLGSEGFKVVHQVAADDSDPPFLECLLRRE